jgi:phage baseplate assembly protein W
VSHDATGPAVHVGFPVRAGARGRTALVDDEAYLRGLVEQVLFTTPGERVNRPDFGSGVAHLVFAPLDDESARATQGLVHAELQRHLGDLIAVEQVEVVSEDSTLDVTVVYRPLRSSASDPRRVLTVSSGSSP